MRAWRIIPAPAGNALNAMERYHLGTDHPRACGERCPLVGFPSCAAGSSPRLRGTHHNERDRLFRTRIIPAPAGNASAPRARTGRRPDHPRACGERVSCDFALISSRGSSPRLRGTLLLAAIGALKPRIIPAPAGNASIKSCSGTARTDHPRACGERPTTTDGIVTNAGSSPRLRGTPEARPHRQQRGRIIPAPAGNASPCRGRPSRPPDHPRACGERLVGERLATERTGSSPRLRGTPRSGCAGPGRGRIIPAPAGNAF